MDPLLSCNSQFSLEKKFNSQPNLPFSPSFSLEKFSSKPSLVVKTVDPLLPFSAKFSLEKKDRS